MKILLANKFFFLNGGSERVFFQERDFLIKHGHDVIDFSMKDERNLPSPYDQFFVPNINYEKQIPFSAKINNSLSFIHSSNAVKKLTELLVQEKPKIAHLHNIYHQLTPSIITVLKRHGIKVVHTLHDYKLICPGYLALKGEKICSECEGKHFWKPFSTNCQGSRFKGLLLSAEALWHKWQGSYNGVDMFLSPSKFLADLTSKRINQNKIKVLHNGINIDEYQPNFDDQGYAIYFGRLSKEKGIETLLQANRVSDKHLPLKILGTGPLSDELEKEFPEADFLGYQSGQELNDLIANAAFVVVPSEWHENCSMAVLEAMAFAKPIIGSRIGGIPEQIEDGKTGFLFEAGKVDELAKKMELLAGDAELRRQMGRAARKKLEQGYTLADHNRQLLEIYTTLEQRGRPQAMGIDKLFP